ncbi:Leucine aminopeptidase 1 [Myotisia sp. PD_48]|nr:Leucine aminopeptidase 1 [Myotisia sp. PD_48]
MRSISILSTAAGLLAAVAGVSGLPSNDGQFLVETAPGERRWVTRDEKMQMIAYSTNLRSLALVDTKSEQEHKRFFDVTRYGDSVTPARLNARTSPNYPTTPAQITRTNWAIAQVAPNDFIPDVTALTAFHTRYSESTTGVDAAKWVYQRAKNLFEEYGCFYGYGGPAVTKFQHANSSQFTTVATLRGTSNKTIVIGAHIDSMDKKNPPGRAPGADDNASGVSLILAALETLLKNPTIRGKHQPNTIEFHWYAGHENGKFGAAELWAAYSAQGRNVKAMLDQDIVGYFKPGTREEFGMITDFINPDLNEFLKMVIDQYTNLPYITFDCGFACGDHGAPFMYGFPSAKVLESSLYNANPYIHTANDTANHLIYTHVYEHYKMVMGYLIELAFEDDLAKMGQPSLLGICALPEFRNHFDAIGGNLWPPPPGLRRNVLTLMTVSGKNKKGSVVTAGVAVGHDANLYGYNATSNFMHEAGHTIDWNKRIVEEKEERMV